MTAFYLSEHLNAHLEHLGTDRYHLFINGRWTYAYYDPEELLKAYREFEYQGQACTVVAAGEIVFYCRRRLALELCYETPRGAGVVKYLHDAASTEKALKALARRHIEADLYVSGEQDANGNRAKRVGGVDNIEGDRGERVFQWQWWYDPGVFAAAPATVIGTMIPSNTPPKTLEPGLQLVEDKQTEQGRRHE